jgi:NDP-sugar pyrophosphorylase family protein
MLPVAVLSGGLATRLRPLTERVPKSLIPIVGRPFVFHQLELLKTQGIDRVVLCIGHLGDQIESAVGDGRRFGLEILYSSDGADLKGTGGALRRALPLLGDRFFVLNGDSYLRLSYAGMQLAHDRCGCPAMMAVFRNDNRWDRSNVRYRDGRVLEYVKSQPRAGLSHIDFGVSVLSADALSTIAESQFSDLSDVCAALAVRGQLAGFEVYDRFFEIGSEQGIRDTEAYLLGRMAPV